MRSPKDVSANGLLFRGKNLPGVNSAIEFTMRMPGHIMGSGNDVLIHCVGRGRTSSERDHRGCCSGSDRRIFSKGLSMKSDEKEQPSSEAMMIDEASMPAGIRVILARTLRRSTASGCERSLPWRTTSVSLPRPNLWLTFTWRYSVYPTDVVVLEGQLIVGTTDAIPKLVRTAPEVKLIVQVVETDESNTVDLYPAWRTRCRSAVDYTGSADQMRPQRLQRGRRGSINQSVSWVIDAYRSQATTLTGPRTQPKLSKKELAIISCITRGMRNKEIALPGRDGPSRSSRITCARCMTSWASPTGSSLRFTACIISFSRSTRRTPNVLDLPPTTPVRTKQ